MTGQEINEENDLMEETGCVRAVTEFLRRYGDTIDKGCKHIGLTTRLDDENNKVGVAMFWVGDVASVEERMKTEFAKILATG